MVVHSPFSEDQKGWKQNFTRFQLQSMQTRRILLLPCANKTIQICVMAAWRGDFTGIFVFG
ncbi:hypothetical protein CLOSTMETH_03478 [[Clostridium] methylpentosum DSM 5476]|uniref:Uncharacterized protein n=1 Tax=[Clostridium] methylpentosum DSM 5476 TaxID=537013 RepID=C0EHY3_9FIRM|nr:hypothetical protein CLOSTMETH_03478 [[Clostridium] methylpentosum DSM 5476]